MCVFVSVSVYFFGGAVFIFYFCFLFQTLHLLFLFFPGLPAFLLVVLYFVCCFSAFAVSLLAFIGFLLHPQMIKEHFK